MRLNQYICIVLSLIIFSASNCMAGRVYKCTDQSGNVRYSDSRCSEASKKETVRIQRSATTSIPQKNSDYYSVVNQARRMKAEEEKKDMQRAIRRTKNDQAENKREAKKKADELYKEAQKLYKQAASGKAASGKGLTVSGARALQEQAKSLERQADVLLGRRATSAPTRTEEMESKIRDMEDDIRRNRSNIDW